MRLLGIDYGTKRVGLALSDETGTIATPLCVLCNDTELIESVRCLIEKNAVEGIVLGDSHTYEGKPNPVMEDIKAFGSTLEEEFCLPIYYESEVLTSQQAARHETTRSLRDASAAALILQGYLDRTTTS